MCPLADCETRIEPNQGTTNRIICIIDPLLLTVVLHGSHTLLGVYRIIYLPNARS